MGTWGHMWLCSTRSVAGLNWGVLCEIHPDSQGNAKEGAIIRQINAFVLITCSDNNALRILDK